MINDERQFMSKREQFPAFFKFARHLRSAVIAFTGSSDNPNLPADKVIAHVPLDEANSVSSQCRWLDDWHRPVLDLDMPCLLLDSTNNHHLIIDRPMPWADYVRLLEVMRDVGLLEAGFVNASLERGASWIRTPWTRKGDPLPEGYEVPPVETAAEPPL